MPTDHATLMPSQEAWELLIKLRDARAAYKAEDRNLVKARKKLLKDLAGLPENSDEFSLASRRFAKVFLGIERCRAERDFLADSMEEAIQYAAEGRIFDDNTLSEIHSKLRAEDIPLFRGLVKDAGVEDKPKADPLSVEVPAGKKPRGGKDKAAVAHDEAISIELEALLKDPKRWEKPLNVFVQDEPLALLQKVGLLTLGNAFWFIRKDADTFVRLGLTPEVSEELKTRLVFISNGMINPPPDGMHIEQPKPAKRPRGAKPAAA